MTSTRLVADVGGTNTRLGLTLDGVLRPDTIESFRNDGFDSFDSVLARYLGARTSFDIADMVVAVAGPVDDGKANLTNRGWSFDQSLLSRHIQGNGVKLLNDLAALGQASAQLGPDCVSTVFKPDQPANGNGQALIVGVGTGFNLSPVLIGDGQVTNLNVEYGHISLTQDVAVLLNAAIPKASSRFNTIEEVFSGRGYAGLLHESGISTVAFDQIYARLLATLTRNLTMAFLPRNGIYFAGGVARNLLCSDAKNEFCGLYQSPFTLNTVRPVPVYAILDDAAALKGCAAFRA